MLSPVFNPPPFKTFGATHLATLALTAIVGVALAWLGQKLRGKPQQQWLSHGMAVGILLLQGSIQLVAMAPANFAWDSSLPLQLCDVAWIVAIPALWTYRSWAFGIVYYWGLTATVLAMVTPDLQSGFPSFQFFKFFFGHAIVVVAAIYLCWGVGLRPNWRLYRRVSALTIAYALVIYVLNGLLGVNYVYLNRPADPGTLLEYFGPYPMHVLVCTLIALTGWAALTWPWSDATDLQPASTTNSPATE
jgi:hypothetical integral membrane protein (TIGR02206 family)